MHEKVVRLPCLDYLSLAGGAGADVVQAVRKALRPGGYLRILSCQYPLNGYEVAGRAGEAAWRQDVEKLADVFKVPLVFPEGQPIFGPNYFTVKQLNGARELKMYMAGAWPD